MGLDQRGKPVIVTRLKGRMKLDRVEDEHRAGRNNESERNSNTMEKPAEAVLLCREYSHC